MTELKKTDKTLLDTQIISYAMKQIPGFPPNGQIISSTTAQEFLLAQDPTNSHKTRYALPNFRQFASLDDPELIKMLSYKAKRSEKWGLRRLNLSDHCIIDIAPDYRIVEQGHASISLILNGGHRSLFKAITSGLDKTLQRTVHERFEFLLSNEVHVIPIRRDIVELGRDLMREFRSRHNPKANVRNSMNDMLILSTAKIENLALVTTDKLLVEFGSNYFSVRHSENRSYFEVHFPQPNNSLKKKNPKARGTLIARGLTPIMPVT